MNNFSINHFFDIVFIPLKVSTDEEKEKGCLSLTPRMLDISEENTQETSSDVNVNEVPDQSNDTSPGEENHVVDKASSLPRSTEGTLNSNNDEVFDDTDPADYESIQPSNNLASDVDVTPGIDKSNATLDQNVDLDDCVPSVNNDNLKKLSLLDCACHPIFSSPRAFFNLVVNMKMLPSIATEAFRKISLINSNWTYAGKFLFLY